MNFSLRQQEIIRLVKESAPLTGEKIAEKLNLTRATLRSDLAILTMTGVLAAKPKVGYVFLSEKPKTFVDTAVNSIKVKEIMSECITVDENTFVYEAIIELFKNDAGTMFVDNNGYLVGAVSRKDFLKSSMGGVDINKVPVGIIMTRMPNIIVAFEEDSAYDAAKKIMDHEVDCLPVVKKETGNDKEMLRIVGKISKTNITRLFIELSK